MAIALFGYIMISLLVIYIIWERVVEQLIPLLALYEISINEFYIPYTEGRI